LKAKEVIKMQDINERPLCHRAEDLVTYLYGEAGEIEANDFADHLQVCDACRTEFAMFRQVHDSILEWRNEALGATSFAVTNPAPVTLPMPAPVQSPQRLSALASVREFFNVSPLWLRGAVAFASLLLCVLAIVAALRFSSGPAPVANVNDGQKLYTESDLKARVAEEVQAQVQQIQKSATSVSALAANQKPGQRLVRRVNQTQVARLPHARLTRQEGEQLAADLRLTQNADEEEFSLVLPSEPKLPDEPN
jgi:anti-sigma factor RsiW